MPNPSGKPARVLDYLREKCPQRGGAHLVGIELCRAGVFEERLAVFLLAERALAKAFCSAPADLTNTAALFLYQCYSLGNSRTQHYAVRDGSKSGMPPPCNRTVATQPLQPPPHGDADISRIIEMAWEDRTAFEAIAAQFGLNEPAVVALMCRHLKPSSFRMWRKRMAGRTTKHAALRGAQFLRHCATHTRQ